MPAKIAQNYKSVFTILYYYPFVDRATFVDRTTFVDWATLR